MTTALDRAVADLATEAARLHNTGNVDAHAFITAVVVAAANLSTTPHEATIRILTHLGHPTREKDSTQTLTALWDAAMVEAKQTGLLHD